MTQTHQTQCPNCQHHFDVTDEQLALKSGFARCPDCHKIFSAIDYLTAPNPPAVSPAATALPKATAKNTDSTANRASIRSDASPIAKPAVTKAAATDGTKDTLLFDDHSGLDEAGAVITQPKSQTYRVNSSNRPKSKASTRETNPASGQDFDIIDNFDQLPASQGLGFAAHTANTDQEDEAWLEQLLAEDQANTSSVSPLQDKLTQRHNSPNDVTSLLDELGVDVTEEQAPSDDEYLKRVTKRFESQSASQKRVNTSSAGMTAIWTLGSVLLAGLLAAQYLIFNADNLLKTPQGAAHLTRICQSLPINCNLPIADTTLIQADILSLEPAKNDTKKTDMIIALKNQSNTPNLSPNLKVTLRAGNETKAQFIVPIQQYIEANNNRLMGGQIKPLKFRIDYPRKQFDQANIDLYY